VSTSQEGCPSALTNAGVVWEICSFDWTIYVILEPELRFLASSNEKQEASADNDLDFLCSHARRGRVPRITPQLGDVIRAGFGPPGEDITARLLPIMAGPHSLRERRRGDSTLSKVNAMYKSVRDSGLATHCRV
jgi:hypothetical protein